MTAFTYAELLDFLGLTNWQFIGVVLLLLLAWAAVKTLWQVGAVGKIRVGKKAVPEFKAVFISYEGSINSIGAIFSQSVQDFEMVFKFSSYFVIYYSVDSQQAPSRAVIGVAVNKMEESRIALFLNKFPMYRTCSFPSSAGLAASYPLVNGASSLLAVAQVYPAVQQKLSELGIQRKRDHILEFYHTEATPAYLDVIFPFENQDAFEIWYEPTDYSRVFPRKQQ